MKESPRSSDLPPVDSDVLEYNGRRYTGYASFYRQESGGLVPVVIPIDADASQVRPLNPFLYNKPPKTVNLGVKPPEGAFSLGDPRPGNIPVAVVRGVMRGPNHLYEIDDGIVTAFDVAKPGEPQEWETRYYPKNCLEPGTWQEALSMLGIDE